MKLNKKRIEAYHEIPSLLEKLDNRGRELAIQQAEELPKELGEEGFEEAIEAVALECLTHSSFKEAFPEASIEVGKLLAVTPENERGVVAAVIMSQVIAPALMELCLKGMEESMAEIKKLCSEGIDEELDKANKPQMSLWMTIKRRLGIRK